MNNQNWQLQEGDPFAVKDIKAKLRIKTPDAWKLMEIASEAVVHIESMERKIIELENMLRCARIESHSNRADAELYRHVRTLSAKEFADIYTRNIAGHGAFDDLVSQSLRRTLEQKCKN